jgi:hypothetical protein
MTVSQIIGEAIDIHRLAESRASRRARHQRSAARGRT